MEGKGQWWWQLQPNDLDEFICSCHCHLHHHCWQGQWWWQLQPNDLDEFTQFYSATLTECSCGMRLFNSLNDNLLDTYRRHWLVQLDIRTSRVDNTWWRRCITALPSGHAAGLPRRQSRRQSNVSTSADSRAWQHSDMLPVWVVYVWCQYTVLRDGRGKLDSSRDYWWVLHKVTVVRRQQIVTRRRKHELSHEDNLWHSSMSPTWWVETMKCQLSRLVHNWSDFSIQTQHLQHNTQNQHPPTHTVRHYLGLHLLTHSLLRLTSWGS